MKKISIVILMLMAIAAIYMDYMSIFNVDYEPTLGWVSTLAFATGVTLIAMSVILRKEVA